MTHHLDKLVVIGVGLIGGSFALALRQGGHVSHITGIGRSRQNLQRAIELGIIDEQTDDFSHALQGADFVLLAAPVGQNVGILQRIAPHLEEHTIVSDVGSTKQNVIQAARSHLHNHIPQFIPAHPIAGTEFSGADAADATLFQGKPVILTPIPENNANANAIEQVASLWQQCGAIVSHMTAAQHDQVLATISHLPHLLAFALMNHIRATGGDQTTANLQLAGTSLKDMTRIAGSSPEMWRDICIDNREALIEQIETYQYQLTNLQDMLRRSDSESLERFFLQARDIHRKWLLTDRQPPE
ncbi:MAG: prephenate dehydrogenase/arogenate dehydrogenase family protein [Nitrosomonas sp.]|nr:prephenate dehydrogenase/arogenate dehydrogenase family protein [Nitrosomonas sp.]